MRSTAALALALLVSACSSDDSPAERGAQAGSGGSGGASASSGSGGSGGGSGGGSACAINEVPLLVTESGGVPTRLHAPVVHDGTDGVFLFDTGSALTFLQLGADDPDFVPEAGTVTIGCETRAVPGRGGLAPHPDEFGLPVLGYLGADFLLAGTTLLDTEGALLSQHGPGSTLPGTDGWPVLELDDVQGHIISPVTLDGEPVRLMFDTGAPHILWLGKQGEPGDQEVITHDAEGTEIVLYYGSVELVMAGRAPVEVPVLRAPSFPYFEQTVAALGGNIHGLLGLSALRGRAIAVDGAAEQVRLGPVPQ
jgi:hypothetical protein